MEQLNHADMFKVCLAELGIALYAVAPVSLLKVIPVHNPAACLNSEAAQETVFHKMLSFATVPVQMFLAVA